MGRHDDEHLRRFVAARAAGDAVAMRRWWEELVITLYDRIDALVGLAHQGRLDDDEHDEAVALAMARVSQRLIDTFDGTSMGELVNATKTLAGFICIDVQRSAATRNARTRSLDGDWDEDGQDGSRSAWEYTEAQEQAARLEHRADMDEFLASAMPQLPPAQRRAAQMTFDNHPIEEICAALDVSRDNAYKLRSRAFKHLAKLLADHEAAS